MKTKKQIINTLRSKPELFNADKRIKKYIDEATEGLNQVIEMGYSSYDKALMNGSYNQAVIDSKIVSRKLNQMGFYARVGVKETTPSGNERPFVRVMLCRPEYEPSLLYKIFHSIF
jgi:hypothetical protein